MPFQSWISPDSGAPEPGVVESKKTNGMPDASRLTQTMASGRFPCYNCGKVLQGALQSDAYEFEARCPRCNSVTLVCFSQAKAPARGESESIEKPSPRAMTASIERPS